MKIATIFSGIGAAEQALKRLKKQHEIIFACDNGERNLKISIDSLKKNIDNNNFTDDQLQNYIENLYESTGKTNYVQKSYLANYEMGNGKFYQDVRFIDGKNYLDENIDLFVGGSPCQSFSISGKRRGLEDTRGTLFYDFVRLVNEVKPKTFIYENVPGILSHDNGKTWEIMSQCFDDVGYSWKMFKLNSSDFNVAQNRNRIFVIGIRDDFKIIPNFTFINSSLNKCISDYLDNNIDEKYYHGEKGFKWITKPLSLKKRVSINAKVARTQSANQQFNWCGDMVFEELGERVFSDRVFRGEYNGVIGVARKLTPRECLRLMGFDDSFKIVVPDKEAYRQSGNSIVVDVLMNIISKIEETGVWGIHD